MATLIQSLMQRANEKLRAMEPKIVLDEEALNKLVADAASAQAALEQWRKEKEISPGDKEGNEEVQDGEEGGNEEDEKVEAAAETMTEKEGRAGDKEGNEEVEEGAEGGNEEDDENVEAAAETMTDKEETENLAASIEKSLKIEDKPVVPGNCITARILYMVPPKKTHRRGDKPGNAYLILQAPRIESLAPVKEPPTTIQEEGKPAAANDAPSSKKPPPPAVDYSRVLAKRRLMLRRALEAMQAVVAADNQNTSEADKLVLEESLNNKVWKIPAKMNKNRQHDRMVGTIFETPDYQQFLEQQAAAKEERQARPKPAPGGGVSTAATTEGGENVNGQPVAALVLHLQKKQEEEKKRKTARRTKHKRVPAATAPTGGKTESSSTSNNIGAAAATAVDKKKGPRRKKKRGTTANGGVGGGGGGGKKTVHG